MQLHVKTNKGKKCPSGFYYSPESATITWKDKNGQQSGNLSYFRTKADPVTTDTIIMQGQNLASFSLGQEFVNLQNLNLQNNHLNFIELTHCPNLLGLAVSSNNISSLNLNLVSNLKTLNCAGNPISSLNLTPVPNLINLRAGDCQLTVIDVSMLPLLEYLDVASNQLTDISLTNNIVLNSLVCYNMQIVWVHIDTNPLIKYIDLGGNAPAASIAAISDLLEKLDGFGLLNGHAALNATAVPDAAGQIAVTNLLAKGWNLQIDT